MNVFWYVYVLETEMRPKRFYVGFTNDLKSRWAANNAGDVAQTSKFLPWRIRTAIAFDTEARTLAFERYLKSSSGRAFANKRF